MLGPPGSFELSTLSVSHHQCNSSFLSLAVLLVPHILIVLRKLIRAGNVSYSAKSIGIHFSLGEFS